LHSKAWRKKFRILPIFLNESLKLRMRTFLFPLIISLFFLCHCAAQGPEYMPETEARSRLYALAILKCLSTGGDPNEKTIEIVAFVEKQFKTNTLSESERQQVTYYKSQYYACERQIMLFPLSKCEFKDIELFNLATKGKFCKLEPASYYQFR
jgi:outer membrane lipoprotein-sorting protein